MDAPLPISPFGDDTTSSSAIHPMMDATKKHWSARVEGIIGEFTHVNGHYEIQKHNPVLTWSHLVVKTNYNLSQIAKPIKAPYLNS